MDKPLAPGIHRIAAEQYHADPMARPSLSSTLARVLLDQSPLHAFTAHPRLNPAWEPVEKKIFDIGRAAHRAILGAGEGYVAYPSELLASNGAASTKAAKEWADEARASGLTPLKADEVDTIGAIEDSARRHLDALSIKLNPERSEVVALADIDGTFCRSMIDNAPEDPSQALYDVKTTINASPEHCTRAVMSYGYDTQAAHYLDTWRAVTGETRLFRFLFIEKSPPFACCVVQLGEDTLSMAKKKTARAREIWRQCVESDHWPSYPLGVHQAELPDWFHERWLERESVEADFKANHGFDILDAARRWQSPEPFAAE